MTGYTEFVPINLKAVFTKIDTASQQITSEIFYQGKTIVTLHLDFSGNIVQKDGSFIDLSHLQECGIDEGFILDRINLEMSNIINKNVALPFEFYI